MSQQITICAKLHPLDGVAITGTLANGECFIGKATNRNHVVGLALKYNPNAAEAIRALRNPSEGTTFDYLFNVPDTVEARHDFGFDAVGEIIR